MRWGGKIARWWIFMLKKQQCIDPLSIEIQSFFFWGYSFKLATLKEQIRHCVLTLSFFHGSFEQKKWETCKLYCFLSCVCLESKQKPDWSRSKKTVSEKFLEVEVFFCHPKPFHIDFFFVDVRASTIFRNSKGKNTWGDFWVKIHTSFRKFLLRKKN